MGNSLTKKKLLRCTKENTPFYRFDNKKFYCKVIDVYDGDTITIAVKLNSKIYQYKVRMHGYDSPEMKPRLSIPGRDEIIQKARKAKEVLSELVLDKIVVVEIKKKSWDKYGRLLGIIYISVLPGVTMKSYNLNVNEYMIERGHGYRYEGGKKH